MKKKTKRALKKALSTFQNNVIGGDKNEMLREREKRAVIKGKVRRAAYYGP
jgi:hypothetical protein